jgi:hypothetical protein
MRINELFEPACMGFHRQPKVDEILLLLPPWRSKEAASARLQKGGKV